MKSIYILILASFILSCHQEEQSTFDIQGHRGCRGLLPENSIIGFEKAIDLGVNTLEMDVVITKDKQVLVSHEPWMNEGICLDSTGNEFVSLIKHPYNIYELTLEEVQQFDCGSKGNVRFPNQEKVKVYKPTLDAVLKTALAHPKNKDGKLAYNIEIKSSIEQDEKLHPKPKEFVDLVMQVIESNDLQKQTIIQSFDPRPLKYLNDHYPNIKTAFLTDNQLGYRHNLSRLDFKPTIFSPDYNYVTEGMIKFFSSEGILVIPWTVNEPKEMQKLIDLGVDGIITDYPDRLIELVGNKE